MILGSSLGAVLTLSCLIVLRIREKPPCGPRIPVRRRLTQAALPLALADDLKSGITTAENLMVPKRLALHAATPNPLAAFGTVSGMVFPVIMFPAAILFGLTELLIPELARCNAAGSGKRIHYLVRKSLRVALVYGIFFGGAIFLLGEELCLWLYKSRDAARYLKLYAILIPILYCDVITDAMIKGLGQQKVCVRYNIVTSAMDVAFLYYLLPDYGMNGYWVSFLVTHLINFVLSFRRLMTITIRSVPAYIPLFSCFSVIFSVWAASYVATPWIRFLCYGLILGSLLFLFKVITFRDIRWIRSLIYKKDPTNR